MENVEIKKNIEQLPYKEIYQYVNKELFSYNFVTKDVGISSRLINHWRSLGILLEKEREFDQNYKFNFLEFMWLKTLIELRDLGLSMANIKTVKEILTKKDPIKRYLTLAEDLYSPEANKAIEDFIYNNFVGDSVLRENFILAPSDIIYIDKKFQYSQFELGIISFLKKRKENFIYIFPHGSAVCDIHGNAKESEQYIPFFKSFSYITIPIYGLVKDFFDKDENLEFAIKSEIIDPIEGKILEIIREGKFDTITIEFNNGKPKFVVGEKNISIDEAARVREYIFSREYANISISIAGGNILYATKSTRLKL